MVIVLSYQPAVHLHGRPAEKQAAVKDAPVLHHRPGRQVESQLLHG